ncbi:T6SS phospholipase effector Tle1-like catalytic domain-containing protein [Flavobacterium tegetincola]|uniref:T6SS phospholipase effector Tle1-like catalytic domain-containing protein n=1 Tax=Flavobacterium tegetincola TaxID=150172 RepID=UPI0004111B02|nr:DUF2235 domain-containing protein [Flavobacterium tegetincola]
MENNNTLRISIFFDGTGNNAKNAYEREKKGNVTPKTGGSYDISPTNIYRLFCNLEQNQNDTKKALYIEGIGTFEGLVDSTMSAATGFDIWDGYDASAKTSKAFQAVEKVIADFNPLPSTGNVCLKFDLFGFSRGAALARNFANILQSDQIKKDRIKTILNDKNQKLEAIEFGFIGLFDTVESIIYPPKVVHFNLDLAAIKADCIFHLAALHECRENFPLTSVIQNNSGTTSPNLDEQGSRCNTINNTYELFVPGAHSDVGGGYNACQDENATINDDATYTREGAKKLVEHITEVNPVFLPLLSSIQYEFETLSAGFNAISKRKNVHGHLQLLYAKLMAVTAQKFGVPFDLQVFDVNHTIPNDLIPYYEKLSDSSQALIESKKFKALHHELTPELVQKYVHISVSTRTIMGKEEEVETGPLLKSTTAARGGVYIVNRPANDWKRKIISL